MALVGAWLNKATKGTADDYSSLGNDGIVTDVIYTKIGADFNGSTSKIDVGANVLGTGAKTISAWINPRSGGEGTGTFGGAIVSDGQTNFVVRSAAQALRFMSDGAASTISGTHTFIDNWNHVVVCRDASGICNMYVNGVLSGNADQDSGTPGAGFSNTIIGNTVSQAKTWDGQLKDVQIYNEEKSADWVKNEYQKCVPDDSLVLDVLDGTEDLSKDKNEINPSGGVIVGKEMNFDGVDGLLTIPDTSSLDLDGEFTIGVWVKPNNITDTSIILAKSQGGSSATGGYMFRQNSANLVINMLDGAAPSPEYITQTNPLEVNKWTYVVMTRTGTGVITTGQVKAYVDGIEVAGTESNYGTAILNNTKDVSIGAQQGDSAQPFDGIIKNAKVFNEAKSADFVKQYYERTKRFY